MKKFLKSIRDTWGTLAQFAAAILGMAGAFLADPPQLWPGAGQDAAVRFAEFLVTVLAGLLLIACWYWRGPQHLKRWTCVTAVAAIGGAVSYFAYRFLFASWSCPYVTGKTPLVIGDRYTSIAEKYIQGHPGISCTILIQSDLGRTNDLWDTGEILFRYFTMCAVYLTVVTACTVAIMATIQALRCANIIKN